MCFNHFKRILCEKHPFVSDQVERVFKYILMSHETWHVHFMPIGYTAAGVVITSLNVISDARKIHCI